MIFNSLRISTNIRAKDASNKKATVLDYCVVLWAELFIFLHSRLQIELQSIAKLTTAFLQSSERMQRKAISPLVRWNFQTTYLDLFKWIIWFATQLILMKWIISFSLCQKRCHCYIVYHIAHNHRGMCSVCAEHILVLSAFDFTFVQKPSE